MSDQRFNTGNPIGSNSPLDRSDNTRNLDVAVLSDEDTFQDRLGKSRLTWAGIVKAGTGDAGVIVPIVQQAVTDVVAGVDGQVAVAQSAADRAEVSAAAAFSAGNQFDTTAQGLVVTVDGQIFLIRTEDPQVFDVYLNDEGVAVLQPDQFEVASLTAQRALEVSQGDGLLLDYFGENLFTEQQYTSDLPGVTASGTGVEFVEVGGKPCIAVRSRVSDGAGGARWQFLNPELEPGTRITFGIEVVSSDESSAASYIQLQWIGDNPKIDRIDLDFSGTTEPRWYTVTSIVPPGAVSILRAELYAHGDSVNLQRETIVTKMMLIEADTDAYVPPAQPRVSEVAASMAVTQGDGVFVGNFSPNLFTSDYYSDVQPLPVASGSTVEIVNIDGVPSIRTVGHPTSGAGGARWVFEDPELSSDKITIGFQITSSQESTAASRLRVQWAGDSTGLLDTNLPFSGAVKPEWHAVTMDRPEGHISSITITIQAYGDATNYQRETIITKMMLIGAGTDAYVPFPVSSAAVGGNSTVYLSSNGSDTGTGDQSSPLATLGEAVRRIGGSGSVVVESGDYPGSAFALAASSVNDLKILGRSIDVNSKRPRVRFGTKVSGAVLESGKVYSAEIPIGTGSAANLHWIWQDGVEDASAIPEAGERHSYYRGRNSRLPCTKIWYVEASDATEAIGVINAASGPSFWYDFSVGKLYFSVSGGGNADLADVWIPAAVDTFMSGEGRGGSLELHNLELFYDANTKTRGFGRVVVTNSFSLGNRFSGFQPSGSVKYESCESAGHGSIGGSGGDGWNTNDNGNVTLMGCWTHDNNDDGESIHSNCTIEAYMCISEFNGNGGFVPASGGHGVYFGCTTRKNGQRATVRGGFYASGDPLDDGIDTTMECYGCTAIDELGHGFGRSQTAHAKVFDSVVLRAAGTAYAVDEITNCRESGSGSSKAIYTVVNNADMVV